MTTRLDSIERINSKLNTQEDILELALEAGKIGIWRWDLKNQRLQWDDRMHTVFGTDKAIFTGKADFFFSNVAKEDQGALDSAVFNAINHNKPYEYKFKFISPLDKKTRTIMGRGKVIRNPAGEAIKMVGVCISC